MCCKWRDAPIFELEAEDEDKWKECPMRCARINLWPGKAPPGMRLQTLVSWIMWKEKQLDKNTEGISVHQLKNRQGRSIPYDARISCEEYDEDEAPWSCGIVWQVRADVATVAMQVVEQQLFEE